MNTQLEAMLLVTLTELKTEAESAGLQLKSSFQEDEASFCKIKWNIIDIFEKMLLVSSKQVSTLNCNNPLEREEAFMRHYLGHFEKIPQAWQLNLEKCLSHGLEEEAHIERLKLDTAKVIQMKALALFNQRQSICKEEACDGLTSKGI